MIPIFDLANSFPPLHAGLLDFGQAKQLSQSLRWDFSQLILALDGGDVQQISAAMSKVGVVTERDDAALRSEMAYGMFDTRGRQVCRSLRQDL